MRSTLTILAVLMTMTLAHSHSLSAQYAAAPAMGIPRAAQPTGYGYWVPVVTTDYETPATYGLHLADEPEEPETPIVDHDPSHCDAAGCDCAVGCDSRCSGRGTGCKCLGCCRPLLYERAFGSMEYMSWYNKGIFVPALVTTSPAGTPQAQAGVLPGASILFGNDEFDDTRQVGGRLTFGWWLDDCHNQAIGAKFYGAEGGAVRFNQAAAGAPILARPFFNASPLVNAEDSLLVSFPGLTTGGISATSANDFIGSEVFLRSMIDQGRNYSLDLYGGWQFNRIDSDLAISSTSVQGATTFLFNDSFDVENEFNAGTIGLYGEMYVDCWTFSALGKIGIGNMHQQVAIDGNNTVIAGGTVTTAGGLLTQPTNIGTFERNTFVWAPEVNFKMSCAVTQRLSVSVGYSFLYWTRVAFAGDQVDRAVNDTQLLGGALIGPARPTFNFGDSDFWVQTVDVGVNWNY